MRLRCVVFALAFLAAHATDSWGQSKRSQPDRNQTQRTEQPAATDQRGTAQSPAVVKVLPPEDAQEKAKQEAEDRAAKNDLDANTIRLAWASVVVAFLQFAAIGIQAYFLWGTLRATADAAKAAVAAADHVPKTEQAYLFLELDIQSNVEGIFNLYPGHSERKVEIVFGFRNHGRTPAIVESLQVAARYWPLEDGVPTIDTARHTPFQPGLVISSEPAKGHKVEFTLARDQYNQVFPVGRAQIMFWGKIVYRDVFGKKHETGWCRANACDGRGWRFGGDQTLNYYT